MRVAVIGHVEWIDFLRVRRVPAAGEIIHAQEAWQEPGGGGPVSAVQLAKLAGGATFFTALGDDELGHRAHRELEALGLQVRAVFRPTAQRRAVTFVDAAGERTIIVMGERLGPHADDPLPWQEIQDMDAVFLTSTDAAAVRLARRARVLVATPRMLGVLAEACVRLDALVGSARDPAERYGHGDLDPPPRLVVLTDGAAGGTYTPDGGSPVRFAAAPVPGPVADAYGCGDSFAAGLTYALATGAVPEEAVAFATRCGAAALSGSGPYAGQLRTTG